MLSDDRLMFDFDKLIFIGVVNVDIDFIMWLKFMFLKMLDICIFY